MAAQNPKPIETRYAGHLFRSRLEARWAVFFDHLGIEWEYEKEGYDLGDAGWYLPDFWLPCMKMHFEVKPSTPTRVEYAKCNALAELSLYSVGVLIGTPRLPDCVQAQDKWIVIDGDRYPDWSVKLVGYHDYSCPCGEHDGCCAFSVCSECDAISFGPHGTSVTSCPHVIDTDILSCGHTALVDNAWERDHHPRLATAYVAARSARFEHGQRGAA